MERVYTHRIEIGNDRVFLNYPMYGPEDMFETFRSEYESREDAPEVTRFKLLSTVQAPEAVAVPDVTHHVDYVINRLVSAYRQLPELIES